MALPRITGRQMQRSNVPSATPEEYYRRNVYLPLLADFENQLRDWFDAHKKVVVGLNMLLPKFCASASLSDIDDAVQFYLGDIPSANVIEAEFTLWPTFYPGDFTRVDVDPGTDFFHTEKAEELPSKSYCYEAFCMSMPWRQPRDEETKKKLECGARCWQPFASIENFK
ncbi:hypothetical protein HPB52_004865 [Rhipicephalus sanguineus]|uniref:Uncharacterized protein n=1 Tax=Rhipicephalus sanguineus TaxID=34632 RepID=A0A9D4PUD5_RHISA|nr:hypothetical protein HPB52_004865 [Rhipicephalus sanguineus]